MHTLALPSWAVLTSFTLSLSREVLVSVFPMPGEHLLRLPNISTVLYFRGSLEAWNQSWHLCIPASIQPGSEMPVCPLATNPPSETDYPTLLHFAMAEGKQTHPQYYKALRKNPLLSKEASSLPVSKLLGVLDLVSNEQFSCGSV